MCGFAGFLGEPVSGLDGDPQTQLAVMSEAVRHRGPDDSGIWVDADQHIGLAHRRLSVIDLSEAGHQPMISPSGRYIIAYNGEIYNHADIRAELAKATGGHPEWRGHSDTETLLAAIECWGVLATLEKLVGMFAFALWDRERCELTLARDRVGEKPLYFGWQNGVFLFASELKAIKAHECFNGGINRKALGLQLRHGYIPAPYSIYEGIEKLPAGSFLTLPGGASQAQLDQFRPTRYWSLDEVAEHGRRAPFEGELEEATDRLQELLARSVNQQMISDAPLGAFLSGGVDSSLVTALMQAHSTKPVRTFTIGFENPAFNEAGFAMSVAQHLGTDHTEVFVTEKDALDIVPGLPQVFDEPFSDPSQIPTIMVSKVARENVTVALSGDGADELFGGYGRYVLARNLWNNLSKAPPVLREAVAFGMGALPVGLINQAGKSFDQMRGKSQDRHLLGDRVNKLADLVTASSPQQLYSQLMGYWAAEEIVIGERAGERDLESVSLAAGEFLDHMMHQDMRYYLPDDILAKVDRASMSVSLETRAPFLSPELLSFALSLPLSMKVEGNRGKVILKNLLGRYVPDTLFDRPKMGFSAPVGQWLRGPLREWGGDLLDETRLSRQGLLNASAISRKWREHLSGERNWQYHLWNVLMFQSWLESVS